MISTLDSPVIPPGYKQTEIGVIPEDWIIESLGSVGRWFSGGTPSMVSELYWNGNVPWVSAKDMKVSRLYDSLIRVTEKAIGNGTRLAPPGAVLMVVRGMILAHTLPVAVAARSLAFNQDMKALIARAGVESEFIFRWIQANSQRVLELAGESTHGTKRIPSEDLFTMKVALPIPSEQRAIAEALSDVDKLLGGLDQLIAKKRDLKRATMQQLLTGQTRFPGFRGEWVLTRLSECLLARPDYGINAPAVPYSDRLPSYLRITDISAHGRFCPDPLVSVRDTRVKNFYLNENEIVFARTGASVGKSYLYDRRDGDLVFAGFLIRVRPNLRKLVPSFLAAYATTQIYWNWVRLMSTRSGQPGINGNEYGQMTLLLPNVSEQTAIAAVLSDMDAEIAALEQRREKTRALKQAMMQELLTGKTRLV